MSFDLIQFVKEQEPLFVGALTREHTATSQLWIGTS